MLPEPDEPTKRYDPAEHGLPREHSFPDHARTARSHAGESIEDARNWPGMILVGVGVVIVALTLTAAGYGFEGWAVIGGIVAAVCLLTGIFLIIAEHRKVKAREGRALTDPGGH
ncbi:hypothetical protein AB4305_12295 [Nocardia sp. 2YAB30]|uniref:hypothetical protein n=1 Tax=unclassified Nocardia TaxID=2637762 RepID=UPI003F9AB61B